MNSTDTLTPSPDVLESVCSDRYTMNSPSRVLWAGVFAIFLQGTSHVQAAPLLNDAQIRSGLAAQSFTVSDATIASVRSSFSIAHSEWCAHTTNGNSKVSFGAVQIAQSLGLNPKVDLSAIERIKKAISSVPCAPNLRCGTKDVPLERGCARASPDPSWDEYFRNTVNLITNTRFNSLLAGKSFHPVKISWEDIGRYEGSVWGDRISDVGIWVRRSETDLSSAELALSVRRDSNFRDKILVVPSDRIKIHRKQGDSYSEVTLPERLKELQLTSDSHDQNVIVSNQFAIVPVPAAGSSLTNGGIPPRAAFNFSIFPYGSTNYVITDVIEGSSDAIVGPGVHQLLYSNVDGQKAPFTASRAAERKDLLELEGKLKSQGMDVDVQRYYLIQIPLTRNTQGVQLSNMGTPPFRMMQPPASFADGEMSMKKSLGATLETAPLNVARSASRGGLEKVAIGHGETEGPYNTGAGFSGKRANEPIRVTVVYFVTPVGEVTESDMTTFTQAFEAWDTQAIWGGSFVVKE